MRSARSTASPASGSARSSRRRCPSFVTLPGRRSSATTWTRIQPKAEAPHSDGYAGPQSSPGGTTPRTRCPGGTFAMPVTRLITLDDAGTLARLLTANRDYLAPWSPRQSDRYFTEDGQREVLTHDL